MTKQLTIRDICVLYDHFFNLMLFSMCGAYDTPLSNVDKELTRHINNRLADKYSGINYLLRRGLDSISLDLESSDRTRRVVGGHITFLLTSAMFLEGTMEVKLLSSDDTLFTSWNEIELSTITYRKIVDIRASAFDQSFPAISSLHGKT